MKKTAYRKDILRTIKDGKKRFISILIIVALGVVMTAGLRAACVDLRKSADNYMDAQNLYDIEIQSTLGLTEDDVEAIAALSGIEAVEGAYSETVHLSGETHESVLIKTISSLGISMPYLIEGTLPSAADEIAVTEGYLESSGKEIGDTLTIEEIEDEDETEDSDDTSDEDSDEDESTFYNTEFTITAVVQDSANINNPDSTTAFRDTSTTDYTFFVAASAVNSDIFTEIYLTITGAADLDCYSDEYLDLVSEITSEIESEVKTAREEARTAEVIDEANAEIADAEEEMYEAFAEADEEIAEAEEELADARAQLDEGWEEYYDGLAQIEDAIAELNEAEQTLNEEENKALVQIAEAKAELEENEKLLEESLAELEENEALLEASWAELEENEAALEASWAELEENETLLEQSWAELEENEAVLEASWAELEENETLVSESIAQIEAALEEFSAVPEGYDSAIDAQRSALEETLDQLYASEEELAAARAQLEAAQSELDAGKAQLEEAKAELDAGKVQLEEAQAQLEAGRTQLEEAKAELDAGKAQLEAAQAQLEEGWQELLSQEDEANKQFAEARAEIADGWAEIEDAKAELADGLAELEDGEAEYADGLAEFEESVAEYEQEKADAEAEIADAKAEVADIDDATWYVSDRTSLSGYSNIDSDSGAIEAIGNYFPIIFLAVAVLISLTTITRMVDEERGLIGTYKALGFTDAEIRRKYVIYSLSACLAGSIIGEIGGFIGLPAIVFIIFNVMYSLPSYTFTFDILYGFLGPVIFFAGVGFATWFACARSLKQRPAVLMRPKSPKAGSRVFLERITPLWKRLSFLNKVTARNLFRYKKRLLMTVVGIAGCTGILILGFAIKNSVSELVTLQYEDTYKYDLLAVATDNDELVEYVDSSKDIDSYINVRIDSVTVENDGSKMTVQIIVVPDEYTSSFTDFIYLESSSEVLSLNAGEVLMTKNVGQVLGFSAGDTVSIQDLTLSKTDAQVTYLVNNYLGNNIYMTAETYEQLFDKEYESNGVLAVYADTVEDEIAWADELATVSGVSSTLATQELEDDFDTAFILMDMVVYIVSIMAAALAFVVLFTLSTTNISEREREIATIKVLGFHDREVHTYVNKEMILLTIMGIIPGLVVGYFLSHGMTMILKMPSLYFAVTIYPVSYILAIVLTLVFALLIQLITNKVLNKVDPVEALKSVE